MPSFSARSLGQLFLASALTASFLPALADQRHRDFCRDAIAATHGEPRLTLIKTRRGHYVQTPLGIYYLPNRGEEGPPPHSFARASDFRADHMSIVLQTHGPDAAKLLRGSPPPKAFESIAEDLAVRIGSVSLQKAIPDELWKEAHQTLATYGLAFENHESYLKWREVTAGKDPVSPEAISVDHIEINQGSESAPRWHGLYAYSNADKQIRALWTLIGMFGSRVRSISRDSRQFVIYRDTHSPSFEFRALDP